MQCQDIFCEVCFHATHRKGSRKLHTTKPLEGAEILAKKKLKPSESKQNGVYKVWVKGGYHQHERADLDAARGRRRLGAR